METVNIKVINTGEVIEAKINTAWIIIVGHTLVWAEDELGKYFLADNMKKYYFEIIKN